MLDQELIKSEEEFFKILGDCLSENCVDIVYNFFMTLRELVSPMIEVVEEYMDSLASKGFISHRQVLDRMIEESKRRVEEAIKNGEWKIDEDKIVICFKELAGKCLEKILASFGRLFVEYLTDKVPARAREIQHLIRSFDREKLIMLVKAFKICFADEYPLKMLDALAIVSLADSLSDVESKLLIASSGLLLAIEALYRPVLNFLVCLVGILNGKYNILQRLEKGGLLTVGQAIRHLENKVSEYNFIEKFILNDAYVFRNAFAHADYDVDLGKMCITFGLRKGPKLDLSFDRMVYLIKTISEMYSEVSLVLRIYLFIDENLRKFILEMLEKVIENNQDKSRFF